MVATESRNLHIRSEDDAWNNLERLLTGDAHAPPEGMDLDGWPTLSVKVDDGTSVVTASLMNGLLEYQRALYRSYVIAKYDLDDLRKITEEEKADLEVRFRISAGSTGIDADLVPIIDAVSAVIRNKMEVWHLLVVSIAAGLLFTSAALFRVFMQNRRDIRLAEVASKEKKDYLDHLHYASQEDTNRLAMITDALRGSPAGAGLIEQSANANMALLDALAKTGKATYGRNVVVNGQDALELSKSRRRNAQDIELTGDYRVVLVDSTPADGFRVRLQDAATDEFISAIISDAGKYANDRDNLQKAEWSRGKLLVRCSIEGRILEGEFLDARIMSTELKHFI